MISTDSRPMRVDQSEVQPRTDCYFLTQASSKYSVEAGAGGNFLLVLDSSPEDAGQYRCSVSAINKREIVHQLRIRGEAQTVTSWSEIQLTPALLSRHPKHSLCLSCIRELTSAGGPVWLVYN